MGLTYFLCQAMAEQCRCGISVKFHFTDLAPCRPLRAAGPSIYRNQHNIIVEILLDKMKMALCTTVVLFMIVSLKKSIPFVVKCCAEVSINGSWLANEIDKCALNLMEVGFSVMAIITDNHASTFSMLLKKYEGDNKLFVYHSCEKHSK